METYGSENTPIARAYLQVIANLNLKINRVKYRVYSAVFKMKTDKFFRKTIRSLGVDLCLSEEDMKYCFRRYQNEGYQFLTETCPSLAKSFEQGIASGKFLCPTDFKRRKKTNLPSFLGSWFREVFHDDGSLRTDACPISVKTIRQYLYFWYKLDVGFHPSKVEKVLNSFVASESEIYQIFDQDFITFAKNEISRLCNGYDRNSLLFKHGPGICSNAKNFEEKVKKPFSPISSTWAFPTAHSMNSHHFYSEILPRLSTRSIFDFSMLVEEDQNAAQVILVPKDSRGPRLISCEPMENQYIQQGIAKFLMDRIESCPFIKGHIQFRDQSQNRKLAQLASYDQTYSTLDLKEASDRVSYELVRKIFPEYIFPDIDACRSSSTILPNGSRVKLKKFAPMGSALCFPVLSLVSYLSTIWGLQSAGFRLDEARSKVYVYGDDIIVATDAVLAAKAGLTNVGLMVNESKSFVNSRFAESCGFDGFDGNDVTPLRCKINPVLTSPKSDPNNYAKCVAFLCNLHRHQLFSTYDVLKRHFAGVFGPIPTGSSDSPYICIFGEGIIQDESIKSCYVLVNISKVFEESFYSFFKRRTFRSIHWSELISPPTFGGVGEYKSREGVLLVRKRIRRHWRYTPNFYISGSY